MPTEVETNRELAIAFWENKPIPCPKHAGAKMTGSFVQTTFADHIFLTCERGKETIQIPQRPKQMQFYDQQVEGYVESMQRGDAIRCYRCQSKMDLDAKTDADSGITDYMFTCVRCFSWGRWVGRPEWAKIGKD